MRNIASTVAAATVAGFAAVAAGSAHATVVVVPTLEEMAVASDVVAEVVVGDAKVFKEGGRVITLTDLVVKSAIKGERTAGEKLVVYQLGGTLDGHNAWIAGAHRFANGEHLVIFAVNSLQQKKYGGNVVVPYGIGFGLFQVVAHQDGRTGAAVTEIVGDVVTVDGKMPETRRYDSLAAFAETVRAAAAMKLTPDVPRRQRLAPKMQVTR